MSTPAQQIKDAREKAGLTQGEAAELVGYSISAIRAFEQEITIPKERVLKPILFTLKAAALRAKR